MSRKYFFHGLGRIPSGIPRSLSNTYDTDWSEVVKEGNNRFQKQNRLLHGRAAAWDRVKAKQIEEKDVNRPHPELDEELKQTCQEQLEAELELYGKRVKIHAVSRRECREYNKETADAHLMWKKKAVDDDFSRGGTNTRVRSENYLHVARASRPVSAKIGSSSTNRYMDALDAKLDEYHSAGHALPAPNRQEVRAGGRARPASARVGASRTDSFTDALDATSHGERNTDQADQAPSRHVARARGRARPVSAKVGASRTNSYMDALDAVSDSQRPWARTAPGAAWL